MTGPFMEGTGKNKLTSIFVLRPLILEGLNLNNFTNLCPDSQLF